MENSVDAPVPMVNEDSSTLRKEKSTVKEKIASVAKYPVVFVLIGAIIGVAVGVGISRWTPEDNSKDVTLQWLGLIGDLFVRALKAIVLPLVFISVALSVVDMMSIGRAGAVGWKTLLLYMLTTLIASVIGVITLLAFKGLFTAGDVDANNAIEVTLGCDQDGTFLSQAINGSITCAALPTGASEPPETMKFSFTDVSGALQVDSGGPDDSISLSDTLYDGIFTKLVTDNILNSFSEGQFAAVIFFAIFFGCAIAQHIRNSGADVTSPIGALVKVLKEMEGTLVVLIGWIIKATPVAVFSLIVKALGAQNELGKTFSNVGYLIAANFFAMIMHIIVVHFFVLALVLRKNPLIYLKHLLPAQAMAVASASSAATLPVTMKCVEGSGIVPTSILKFVLPLGATVNMDGAALYFPCACVWLAKLNGIEPTIANYILLIIIATIGSAGTAPVPAAALVLLITAYNTVFNSTGTPAGFEFIVAIDWFVDRFQTALNVTGDCSVSAMVAKLVEKDEARKEGEAGTSEEEVKV